MKNSRLLSKNETELFIFNDKFYNDISDEICSALEGQKISAKYTNKTLKDLSNYIKFCGFIMGGAYNEALDFWDSGLLCNREFVPSKIIDLLEKICER